MIRQNAVSKTPHGKANILLVDDHPVVCQGIRRLLEEEADLAVCGEAQDAEGALEAIRTLKPDLVLLDISLRGRDGLTLTRMIRTRHAGLPVLILSMHDEVPYAERALRAGARGYIMKREAAENVVGAIRQVLRGEIYASESIRKKVLSEGVVPRSSQSQSPVESLSNRELEVFHLIGQGWDTRQIAERLHLSPRTVEMHRARIKRKMALHNATELIRQAVRWVEQQGSA